MLKVIQNIFLICRIKKGYILLNLFGIICISLLEIASIGIIFPFLSVLTKNQSSLFETNSYLNFLNFESFSFEQNIHIGLIIILIIFLLKNILIILINFLQKRSFYNIQRKIKYIAVDNYLMHDFKNNTDSALMVRDINYVNDIFSWLSLALGFISELIILTSIFCFLLIFNFNVSISIFLFGFFKEFLLNSF